MTSLPRTYLQPAFLVCAGILALTAATKSVVIEKLGFHFVKLPIPLKKPFSEMDEKRLEPYKVVNKQKITNRDVVESLGTEEYLQWTIEDPDVAENSPVRYCSLFVTYYTGNPDMVPHVPDECYTGGGNRLISAKTLSAAVAGRTKPVDFQYLLFGYTDKKGMGNEIEFSVQYLFRANNIYAGNRTETRTILGSNFFGKYSYFCKVEWKFFGQSYGSLTYPNQEDTVKATEKMLSRTLPILEEDHWPDWEKANKEAAN